MHIYRKAKHYYVYELQDLALLDGLHEQVVHLLLGGILGQEQHIEAGVSRGKPARCIALEGIAHRNKGTCQSQDRSLQ